MLIARRNALSESFEPSSGREGLWRRISHSSPAAANGGRFVPHQRRREGTGGVGREG